MNHGIPQPDWEVLARYLTGESSPGEAESVRHWLAEDPSRKRILSVLDLATKLERRSDGEIDVEAALRRIKPRLREAEVVSLSRARRRETLFRIVVAVLLATGAILLWWAIRR